LCPEIAWKSYTQLGFSFRFGQNFFDKRKKMAFSTEKSCPKTGQDFSLPSPPPGCSTVRTVSRFSPYTNWPSSSRPPTCALCPGDQRQAQGPQQEPARRRPRRRHPHVEVKLTTFFFCSLHFLSNVLSNTLSSVKNGSFLLLFLSLFLSARERCPPCLPPSSPILILEAGAKKRGFLSTPRARDAFQVSN